MCVRSAKTKSPRAGHLVLKSDAFSWQVLLFLVSGVANQCYRIENIRNIEHPATRYVFAINYSSNRW